MALKQLIARLRKHPIAHLGPGLITGAADDDPSGIATYSQAGAQFGLNMLWTLVLSYPLMAAVQSSCARIGRVTGKGLAANIQQRFSRFILLSAIALLLVANTINIGADLAAMGDAVGRCLGTQRFVPLVGVTVLSLALQMFVPYHRYVKVLKWLTLSLLAYAAVLFTVTIDWHEVLLRLLAPQLPLNASMATVVVGILGTTISPYLFFWQCSEEVEDLNCANEPSLLRDGARGRQELQRIRWDTWGGMLYSNLTAAFIMLATAATLNVSGVHDIQNAGQAAAALRPLAGPMAFYLFALGILGVGLVGVPVLAGSGAYALAEAQRWPGGLELPVRKARGFYAVIALSMLVAMGLGFSPLDPMKALFYSAVINGVVAVPLIALIVLLASSRDVMGRFVITATTRVLCWITVAVMAFAVAGMLLPSGR